MLINQRKTNKNEVQQNVLVGIGGTGIQVLDRLVISGFDEMPLIAMDTDSRALGSSLVKQKIHIGRMTTRGLDSGGDPEVGAKSFQESKDVFISDFENKSCVFLIAGLGGGTGTGALPELARMAATKGARVISLVALPFEFEGRRRNDQAHAGLKEVIKVSDAVFVLPNDFVLSILGEDRSVFEVFENADEALGRASCGLSSMLGQDGFIKVEWQELIRILQPSVLDPGHSCWVGWAEDATENRARAVVDMILKSPFALREELRNSSDEVIISITGGENMLLSEVEYIIRELRAAFPEDTSIHLSTALKPDHGDDVSVFMLASKTSFNTLSAPSSDNITQVCFANTEEQNQNRQDDSNFANDLTTETNVDLKDKGPVPQQTIETTRTTDQETGHSFTKDDQNVIDTENQRIESPKQTTIQAEFLPENSTLIHEQTVLNEPNTAPVEAQDFTGVTSSAARNQTALPSSEEQPDELCLAENNINEVSNSAEEVKHPEKISDSVEQSLVPTEAETTFNSTTEADSAKPEATETIANIRDDLRQKSPQPAEQKEFIEAAKKTQETIPAPQPEKTQVTQPLMPREDLERTQIISPFRSSIPPAKTSGHNFPSAQPDYKTSPAVPVGRITPQTKIYFTREAEGSEPVIAPTPQVRQETLQFDNSSQGRFEKTDATYHNGENLDIPTYLRRQHYIRQVIE